MGKLKFKKVMAPSSHSWKVTESPEASFCVIDLKVTLADRKRREMFSGKLDVECVVKVDTLYIYKRKKIRISDFNL